MKCQINNFLLFCISVNCADVRIEGSSSGTGIEGALISIANFPGYPTVQPPEFSGGPDAPGTVIKYYPVLAI